MSIRLSGRGTLSSQGGDTTIEARYVIQQHQAYRTIGGLGGRNEVVPLTPRWTSTLTGGVELATLTDKGLITLTLDDGRAVTGELGSWKMDDLSIINAEFLLRDASALEEEP